ncbi:MAG: hypothetical protein H6597_05060 [Flavobacteriales bacterium]|nr:hypothetical protein [Flavobacteriales bacterium]MCB9193883.1 hypothetical protein [Flavobacteriales bacterium]
MDKRERYDPEDIEQLLSECRFDELLDAERAYVLRHISGREEYERMRSTLHRLRTPDPERDVLEPDPQVRANVLAAFREARRGRFAIWLNAVGAWLLPSRPALLWRPALALAGLVLVLLVGPALWRNIPGRNDRMVAEVERETPAAQAAPTPAVTPERTLPDNGRDEGGTRNAEVVPAPADKRSIREAGNLVLEQRTDAPTRTPSASGDTRDVHFKAMTGTVADEQAQVADVVMEEMAPAEDPPAYDRVSLDLDKQMADNEVAKDRTASALEAAGGVAASRKEADRSRTNGAGVPVAARADGPDATEAQAHADLLGLLHQAW